MSLILAHRSCTDDIDQIKAQRARNEASISQLKSSRTSIELDISTKRRQITESETAKQSIVYVKTECNTLRARSNAMRTNLQGGLATLRESLVLISDTEARLEIINFSRSRLSKIVKRASKSLIEVIDKLSQMKDFSDMGDASSASQLSELRDALSKLV